jgi:hypothetical protein
MNGFLLLDQNSHIVSLDDYQSLIFLSPLPLPQLAFCGEGMTARILLMELAQSFRRHPSDIHKH